MENTHIKIQFSIILLKVMATFYISLGLILFFNPGVILSFIDGSKTELPYTIIKYAGISDLVLGCFIFESVRKKRELLFPVIYLILFSVLSIYLMLTIKANVYLSLSIYTWRFTTLTLLVVALINELSLRKENSKL
jgi:hypothetical protein